MNLRHLGSIIAITNSDGEVIEKTHYGPLAGASVSLVTKRPLLVADKIIQDSDYDKLREKRYSSFNSGNGKAYEEGKLSLENLHKIAHQNGELPSISGKQELFENIVNQYI